MSNFPPAGAGVNLNELLERVDNDRELLIELISIFKDEFPRQSGLLREAVVKKDIPQVASLSHALRGTLLNLAASNAAAAASSLEQLARAGKSESFREALDVFEALIQGLVPEMDRYLVEVRS